MIKKGINKNKHRNVSKCKADVRSVIWERMKQMWQELWDRAENGMHLYQK